MPRTSSLAGREEQVVARYRAGASFQQLRDELGLTYGALRRVLQAEGVPLRTRSQVAEVSWRQRRPARVQRRELCACGCGRLANEGRKYLHGHHRRRKFKQHVSVDGLEAAPSGTTCEWRSHWNMAARDEDGHPVSGSSLLEQPACGMPVRWLPPRDTAGKLKGKPLCEVHRNSGVVNTAADRRALVTVRCACGWSAEVEARDASATFSAHVCTRASSVS